MFTDFSWCAHELGRRTGFGAEQSMLSNTCQQTFCRVLIKMTMMIVVFLECLFLCALCVLI